MVRIVERACARDVVRYRKMVVLRMRGADWEVDRAGRAERGKDYNVSTERLIEGVFELLRVFCLWVQFCMHSNFARSALLTWCLDPEIHPKIPSHSIGFFGPGNGFWAELCRSAPRLVDHGFEV